MIIFETVHTLANVYIESFLRNKLGTASILVVFWQSLPSHFQYFGSDEGLDDLHHVCSKYSVPLLDSRRAIIGKYAQCVSDGENLLHADFIHPNIHGHLLLACMLGSFLTTEINKSKSQMVVQTKHSERKFIQSIKPIHSESMRFSEPICYSMLKDPIDRPRVVDLLGFTVNSRPQNGNDKRQKRCWEASEVGSFIEILVEASTELLLVWYQLNDDSMGMARVDVDGQEVATINGWFPGYAWTRGSAITQVLATVLPKTPHIVRIEVIEEKNITSGDAQASTTTNEQHNFQLISVAVSSWNNNSRVWRF